MSDAEDEFAGLPEDEEILDDEAGEGSGDEAEGSVDSSEEEEDGENEYEADGFLVDEEEAEGEGEGEGDGEGSDEEVRKVKKKRKKRNFALDEEDYELLEDNQVRVKRPAERKRLKRRGDDEGRGREKASGAKQLQEALFGTGDLEDELEEDAPRPSGRNHSEEGESPRRNRDDYFNDDLSDEMDDFIVDREGGDRRRARRRRDARMAEAAGLSTAAVQAANRLFGNFGELLDLHQSHRMYGEGALDDEMEEEQPSEEEGAELEEDEAERKRLERQERAAARKQQKLLAQVDPELVESHFLRPADQTIRQQDVPERLQLLGKSVLEDVPDEQKRQILDDAARWVADHLFGQHSQSSKVRDIVEDGILEVTGECAERASGVEQGQWPRWMLQDVEDDLDLRNNRALLVRRGKRYRDYEHLSKDQRAVEERRIHERFKTNQEEHVKLQQNVRTVLEHVFEKNEEIPLQAMYRKEGCGELLSLRETDMPETTGNEEKAPSEPDVRWPKGTIQPKHRRIRRWDVLWAVYNWGVRFMELYKRRHRREQQINRAMDLATTDDEKDGLSRCLELLVSKVHTVQGLDDVDAKFRHIIDITNAMADLSIENGEGGAGKPKRPGRPNAFRRYIKLGLNVPAHEVSLSMEEFKENIDKKEAFMSPEDPDISPAEWAAQKIQDLGFDNEEEAPRVGLLSRPQNFLDAIKEVLASELAAEPCLRNLVRNELYQQAVLETNPTPAGEDILDPFHPYGITKHLVEKKVQTLEGHDTWLRIQAAEKQGLITCTLSWPEQNLKELLRDVEELFVSDNTADVAHDWNEWRRGVLATAVKTKLLPQMLNELKARLTTNAIDTVLGQVQDKFWHFVSQPPVRIMEVPDEQDQEPVQMEAPRFMAVVWGSGQAGDGPTTIVQLDGQGNLKDLLTAAQLSGNVPRTVNSGSREMPVFDPAADPKKSRDSHKIREKILEHKPNAILVATTAPQSKQIKDDMEKISQYTESDARFKDDLLPHLENKRVEVMWADDRVASLWANSDAAKAEFPDYSFLVRKAVGVGRMALDPLAIIAVLLGRRKEVLSLRMHELQDRLPSEQLVTRLEQMLISAVAQVGVDINAICANPWRQAPLQFVPGLGPRKARQLLASIAANDNHIKTRMDLYKQDDNVFGASAPSDVAQMGRIVFRNSAPFIRVRRGEVAALQNEEEFDALDDIRINPEEEAILQIILDEAFPDVGEQGAVVDVRTAIESPNNLLQLDMFAVADANGCLYKLPTLVDMLFEMLAPYGELRLHSAVPSDEDAFYLRHGETSESLKDGKLVEAKVVWVGDTEAKVIIQNNSMEAIIPQAQAGNTSMKLNEIFKPGMVIAARIRNNPESEEVYYDENQRRRYTVTLTTATAALEDFETWERRYCSDVDRAYKPLPNKKQQQQQQQQQQLEQAQRTPSMAARAAKQPLQSRQCDHPLFKQMRIFEVVNELKSAPVGTAFFHPYHKPTVAEQLSCIQLSVKLADLPTGPLIFHVEVKESGTKKRTELKVVPPFRIQVPGKSNKPDAFETFDDLDEVVARYVERMVERVTEVTTHRKYEQGDMTSVTSKLKALLAAQPPNSQAGIYCVALDSHRPGNGYIAFGSGGAAANVHREYFSITPDGFYFRQRTLDSVEHVITAFKKHPNFKKEQQASRGQPTHDAGYASAGAHVPQVPGAYPAAPGYAAPAAAGYGYARQQQQQYRPPGGYQQGPAPAAAAAGYGQQQQPPGYGYGQQGGYQQQGYQQHGYQQGYNHHH